MSTGGDGDVIARATIPIEADTSAFDKAFASLGKRAQSQIDQTIDKIREKMARTKIEMKKVEGWAPSPENLATLSRLSKTYDSLEAKIRKVQETTVKRAAVEAQVAADKRATADERAADRKATADKRAADKKIAADKKAAAAQIAEEKRIAEETKRIADRQASNRAAARKNLATDRAIGDALQSGRQGEDDAGGLPARSDGKGRPGSKPADKPGKPRSDRASGGFGQVATGLSRLAEDVSLGGVIGGVNNVPEVVRGIGTAAGMSASKVAALTAGASGLAVAGFLIYQNWDRIREVFGSPVFKTIAEQMEELGKQVTKTADETDRLRRYEEKRAAVQGQQGAKSEAEQTRASRVREAIGEAGYGTARSAARQVFGQRIENALPQEVVQDRNRASNALRKYERDNEATKILEPAAYEKNVAKLRAKLDAEQKKVDAAINEGVQDYLAKMENDSDLLGEFIKQITENTPNFTPKQVKLAGHLIGATPEAIEGERDQRVQEQRLEARRQNRERQAGIAAQFGEGTMGKGLNQILLDVAKSGDQLDPQSAKDRSRNLIEPLRKAGVDEGDVEAVAEMITKTVMEKTKAQLRERIGREGGTLASAANATLKDLQEQQKAEREEKRIQAIRRGEVPPEEAPIDVAALKGPKSTFRQMQADNTARRKRREAGLKGAASDIVSGKRGNKNVNLGDGTPDEAPWVTKQEIAAKPVTVMAAPPEGKGGKTAAEELLATAKSQLAETKRTADGIDTLKKGVPARVAGR